MIFLRNEFESLPHCKAAMWAFISSCIGLSVYWGSDLVQHCNRHWGYRTRWDNKAPAKLWNWFLTLIVKGAVEVIYRVSWQPLTLGALFDLGLLWRNSITWVLNNDGKKEIKWGEELFRQKKITVWELQGGERAWSIKETREGQWIQSIKCWE